MTVAELLDRANLGVARGGDGAAVRPINGAAAARYFDVARAAGCPADQLRNLLKCGVVLQPKQLLASSIARACDLEDGPSELAYGGARGGGKSFWLVAQLADDCLRYPGLKCLLLRKVGGSGKEAFEDLLPRVLGGISYTYIPSQNLLLFANGSRIKLGHFQNEKDVDKYIGIEYDAIGVEEATTLTLTKYRAILSCNRTSKPGWRPRIYSTTNPGGIGHGWYKARFIDPATRGVETDTRYVGATVDDNAHINSGYTRILEGLTGWQLRAWRHGDWDCVAGQYFRTFSLAHHRVPKFGELPRHWRYWMALDYGFQHYTAAYLFGAFDGVVYVIDEHGERQWRPEQHSAEMLRMLSRHGLERSDLETILVGLDVKRRESDGSAVIDAYAELGWHFDIANQSRRDGAFEFLRRLGDPANPDPARRKRPSLFISESCPRLLACLPEMIHDDVDPEKVAKVDTDDDGVGGDDWFDSARYGLMYMAGGPRVAVRGESIEDLAR